LARQANARLPKNYPVYPFSKGREKVDSGPFKGIYAVRYYDQTAFADLTANQATLTEDTQDGYVDCLKVVQTGSPGQAQLVTSGLEIGRLYQVQWRYYTAGEAVAAEIAVYDGDVTGFGASEPAKLAGTGTLAAKSSWSTVNLLNFQANLSSATIGMEALTNPAWFRSLEVIQL
jgi:hypothetical protein